MTLNAPTWSSRPKAYFHSQRSPETQCHLCWSSAETCRLSCLLTSMQFQHSVASLLEFFCWDTYNILSCYQYAIPAFALRPSVWLPLLHLFLLTITVFSNSSYFCLLCHFVEKGVPNSVFSYFSLQGEDYSCIHFGGD